MDTNAESTPRWKPTTKAGLLIVVLYAAFLLAAQKFSGVDYDTVADSASNLLRFVTLPVAAGVIVLSLVWWLSGWGRSVFYDAPSLKVGGIFWLPVAVIAGQIVFGLAQVSWGDLETKFIVYGLIGTACVGFSEELLVRGLLLDAVRRSSSELQAFFVTVITFGLLHGLNFVNGQGFGLTLQQVISTMVAGVTFYAIRRATGSLLMPMIMHALFDFQILMQGDTHLKAGEVSSGSIFAAGLFYLEIIGAIIITVIMIRGRNKAPQA